MDDNDDMSSTALSQETQYGGPIMSRLLDAFVISSADGVPPADDLN
jgi:hypothetical protein